MAYTAQKSKIAYDSNELRNRIPGWGVDLDPKDRPAVPKEKFNPNTGAHWTFPERQAERWPRERSPEHKFLTPVFGTVCPPKGISGMIRRYAYKFSEGRAAHWLLLMGADRVDVLESRVTGLLTGRPDNPITEAGLQSEIKHHGLRSRLGQHRADLKHQPLDLLIMVGTWLAVGSAIYALGRAIAQNGSAER
ncbi:MAG: hypothetical protein HY282_04855 [Nitrospirae bacterium]|nr:hypothetical protein [Candidatus Manganitrophaceae bacterium]